ncbi:MAG TPA: dipeptidase [Mycobacteriales bacterium]|nr:dipeptidase [Mycobacteriales bacterium]
MPAVVDGHNDLPWALRKLVDGDLGRVDLAAGVPELHTDLPRLRTGEVGAQFWSVFVPHTLAGPAAVATVLEQVDLVHRLAARYPSDLEIALDAADVRRIMATGRIASLLGAEGGHAIDGSLAILRMLQAVGVRYLTLTHNANVPWADSGTDEPAAGGLTDFGRAVVREMQRIGMLVDLSHTAATTMRDTLAVATEPVIFSHSSAYEVCRHPRNVPDDVLAGLRFNGGVCMVTFVPAFVSQECADWRQELVAEAGRRGLDERNITAVESIAAEWAAAHPQPRARLDQVADHVEHVRAVAGIEHVGLGGDYDGTTDLPDGLTDVSCYPALVAALAERGWSATDLDALAHGNIVRVLADARVGEVRGTAPDAAPRAVPAAPR